MANDQIMDYDNMSREQLLEIIGSDADAGMSREELVSMARMRSTDS